MPLLPLLTKQNRRWELNTFLYITIWRSFSFKLGRFRHIVQAVKSKSKQIGGNQIPSRPRRKRVFWFSMCPSHPQEPENKSCSPLACIITVSLIFVIICCLWPHKDMCPRNEAEEHVGFGAKIRPHPHLGIEKGGSTAFTKFLYSLFQSLLLLFPAFRVHTAGL